MTEIILLLLWILYGRCKAWTDALRDYKFNTKMWFVASVNDRIWLLGGEEWEKLRGALHGPLSIFSLPVLGADAWHQNDGLKFVVMGLGTIVAWLTGAGFLHTWILDNIVSWIGFLWFGWWLSGLTFAILYHNRLILSKLEGKGSRWFPLKRILLNSLMIGERI